MSAVDLNLDSGEFFCSDDNLSHEDDGRQESGDSSSSEDDEYRPSQQVDYSELELAQRPRRRPRSPAQRSSRTI